MLVTSACSNTGFELPKLEFETDRAVVGIGNPDAYPLCTRDFADLDRQIEWVEAHLGVRQDGPIVAYVLDKDDTPCREDTVGCFGADEDVVYASAWWVLDHEIVHVVARGISFPSNFWSEGNAELLSGMRTFKDTTITIDAQTLEANTLYNYISASHFARFLVETRGWDSYNRAIRGEPLQAVYGEDAATLTAAYERDAPFSYPQFDPCPYPELPQMGAGVWEEDFAFACDSPEATQFETTRGSYNPDAAILRTLELDPGTYSIELEGGLKVLALRCQTGIKTEPELDPFADDIRFEGYGNPNEFEADQAHVVEISGGTYWFSVATGSNALVEATLRVAKIR